MNNKSWEDIYQSIMKKVNDLKNKNQTLIEDQTENINTMINNIQALKNELIKQLENQEVEDIDKNAKIRDLIKRVEDIERYSDYKEFSNFVETISGSNIYGPLPLFPNIKQFNFNGFKDCQFIGEFPTMIELTLLLPGNFEDSKFTGEFPLLPKLQDLIGTFENSNFTGEFPAMPNLKSISNDAFRDSKFTGEFPVIPNLKSIGKDAFKNSKFTGEFPAMPNLESIGHDGFPTSETFENSEFTGEFPVMPNLKFIGKNAFKNSNFDKDENGFVVNYPGWDGINRWYKR